MVEQQPVEAVFSNDVENGDVPGKDEVEISEGSASSLLAIPLETFLHVEHMIEEEAKRDCCPLGLNMHLIPLCLSIVATTFTFAGSWDCTYFDGATISFTGGKYGLWTLEDINGNCQLWDILFYSYSLGPHLIAARAFSMMAMLLGLSLTTTMAQASQFHLASWGIGFALPLFFLISLSTVSRFNVWCIFWFCTYVLMVLIVRSLFVHPVARRITKRGCRIIAGFFIVCAMFCLLTMTALKSPFCTCSGLTDKQLAGRDPGDPCDGTCTMYNAGYFMITAAICFVVSALATLIIGIQPEKLKTRNPKDWYGDFRSDFSMTQVLSFSWSNLTRVQSSDASSEPGAATSVNATQKPIEVPCSTTSLTSVPRGSESGVNTNARDSDLIHSLSSSTSPTVSNNLDSTVGGDVPCVLNPQEALSGESHPELSSRDISVTSPMSPIGLYSNNVVLDKSQQDINAEDGLGKDEDGLGKDEDGLGQDEDGLGKDEDGLGKDEDGLGKDEDGLGQDEDGLGKDEDGLGKDELVLEENIAEDAKLDNRQTVSQRICCDHRIKPRTRREKVLFVLFRCLLGFVFFIYAGLILLIVGSFSELTTAQNEPSTTPYFTCPEVCAFNPKNPDQEFQSFPSREAARAVNWTVAHCGECGKCSNPHDIMVYVSTRKTIAKTAKSCGVNRFFSGYEGLTSCLQSRTHFTRECSTCWADNMISTGSKCLFTCARAKFNGFMDSNNVKGAGDKGWMNQCLFCDERMSGPAFVTCSGVARRRLGIVSEIDRNPVEQCRKVDIDWAAVDFQSIGFPELDP